MKLVIIVGVVCLIVGFTLGALVFVATKKELCDQCIRRRDRFLSKGEG